MNATECLYLGDSYRTTFHARVIDVRDRNVVLDCTLFHPRDDNQMSDRGYLRSFGETFPILAVERRGKIITHTLNCLPPAVGRAVEGRLDWDFRFGMMRMHTALHIVAAVLHREHRATISASKVYAAHARIGVSSTDLSTVGIRDLERSSNIIVEGGHPVRARLVAGGEARAMADLPRTSAEAAPTAPASARVIEIVGVDVRVDEGTHVANTIEVGRITLAESSGNGRIHSALEVRLVPVD